MTYQPQTTFKDKLAMDQIVFRQIDRTNLTASYTFESSVMQKLNNLPIISRQWVLDQSERYTQSEPTFVFMAPCGVKLGTVNSPILRDQTKKVKRLPGEIDWSDTNIAGAVVDDPILFDPSIPVKRFAPTEIDWDDPNILSPILTEKEYTDYNLMDAIIMEAYEYAGVTWQSELTLLDGGDTKETIERKKTPYRMPEHIRQKTQYRVEEEPEKDEEPEDES